MTDSDDEWIIIDSPNTKITPPIQVTKSQQIAQVAKPPPVPPRPSPEVIAQLFACSLKNSKKYKV